MVETLLETFHCGFPTLEVDKYCGHTVPENGRRCTQHRHSRLPSWYRAGSAPAPAQATFVEQALDFAEPALSLEEISELSPDELCDVDATVFGRSGSGRLGIDPTGARRSAIAALARASSASALPARLARRVDDLIAECVNAEFGRLDRDADPGATARALAHVVERDASPELAACVRSVADVEDVFSAFLVSGRLEDVVPPAVNALRAAGAVLLDLGDAPASRLLGTTEGWEVLRRTRSDNVLVRLGRERAATTRTEETRRSA